MDWGIHLRCSGMTEGGMGAGACEITMPILWLLMRS